jgi:hypothetical protein
MPKVYAPQVPSKYDSATKLWVPSINLDPAKQYGEVVVMLPPNANRLHINPLIVALREQMKDLTEEDYLIAVGDPSLIAAAACIAVKKTNGLLRILKWDRLSSSYIPVEAQT